MTNAVESNVRDYVVPSDSTKLFNNIVTFVKNLTLKDSKLYYDAETPLSEWWGRMFVKYEEYGLTYSEALQVVYFINKYNEQVAEAIRQPENYYLLFGLERVSGDEEFSFVYEGVPYKIKEGSLFDQLLKSTSDKYYYCRDLYELVPPGTTLDYETYTYYKISENEDNKNFVSITSSNTNRAINMSATDEILDREYCVSIKGKELLGSIYKGELYARNVKETYLEEITTDTEESAPFNKAYYRKLKDEELRTFFGMAPNEQIRTFAPAPKNNDNLLGFAKQVDITTDVFNKYTRYYEKNNDDGNYYFLNTRAIFSYNYYVNIDYGDGAQYFMIKRDVAPCILEDLLTIKGLLGNGFSNSSVTVDSVTPMLVTAEFIDTADRICRNIAQAIIILLSMDYIPVRYATSSNTEYKYAATTREKAKLLDGEQLPFVSLRIQNTNIPLEGNASGETESYLSTLGLPDTVTINSGVKSLDVAFIYKELNPAYREILDTKILEVYAASLDNGQFTGIPVTILSKVNSDFNIPVSSFTQEREANDIPYLIQDYFNYIPRTKTIVFYFYLNTETHEIYIYSDSTHSVRLDRNNTYELLIEDTDNLNHAGTFYGIKRNNDLISTAHVETYESKQPEEYDGFTISNNFLILDSTNNPLIYQINSINLLESGIEGNIQLRYDYQEEVVSKTTKLFKYRYGNPYIARRAAESEIITYYIGDNYISDSYGQYNYQKREIRDFLKVFAQTREYFYKVLLNESFANEKEYPLYEKTFILFTSIERFLTKKIENLKDIDSYDETDISNFLASYGLEKLSSLMVSTNFLDEEIFSKSLLENYINLVQNKGSRKVIDILSEALSVGNKDMNIYKILFYHDISGSMDSDTYKFIRADYSLDNIFEYVRNNKDSAMDMESFLENTDNPDLWKSTNTTPTDLKKVGFEIGNTKFIVPELKTEISSEYWLTRVNIEIILILLQYIDENNDNYSSLILGDTEIFKQSGDITVGIGLKGLLYLLTYYYHILYGTEDDQNNLSEIISHTNEEKKTSFMLRPITGPFTYSDSTYARNYGLGEERCKNIIDKLNELFYDDAEHEMRLIYDITGSSKKSVEAALSYIFGDEALFNEMFSNTITAGKLIIEAINALIILGDTEIVGDLQEEKISNTTLDTYLDNTSKTLLTGIFTPIENLVFNYISGVYIKNPISADALFIIEKIIFEYLLGENDYNVLSAHRLPGMSSIDDAEFFNSLEENTDALFNIDILLGSLYTSINEITSTEIAPLKEAIITLADLLERSLSSTLQFNFDGKDDNLLQFLRLAIEYFISYTTEIYRFRSVLTYNSLAETPASLYDNISIEHSTVTNHPLDSFYYDESLDIFEDNGIEE